MSISALLSQKHDVIAYDIDETRVELVNKKKSTIHDPLIENLLKNKCTSLVSTSSPQVALENPEIVIIATPTNYDESKNFFDTSSIESIISLILAFKNNPIIVIKSTIPIGYTRSLQFKFSYQDIVFAPEFLREGSALKDNLFPSRIVVGGNKKAAKVIAKIFLDASRDPHTKILLTSPHEAESIKLFVNTYLAMRVAFFNELDSFAMKNNLNSMDIIEGISSDPRIGNFYNNPSFGYGGYCLPKDTKQLLRNFDEIPQNIISAIVQSNQTRLDLLCQTILMQTRPKDNIGIYRLIMKSNSDNYRDSTSLLLAKKLSVERRIFIFEPLLEDFNEENITQILDLKKFIAQSDLIITNRMDDDIKPYSSKVFSRDLFGNN